MDILFQVIIYFAASVSMFGIIYGGYLNCQRLKNNQHRLAPQDDNFINFKQDDDQFSLI